MGTNFKKIIFTATLLFSFCTSPAKASPENDRIYQLDSVAWLKSIDNSDGVFADYMDDRFRHYFSKQARFTTRTLKNIDEVFAKSKAKYGELVQDPDVLRKISQKYRVESLIRTHVYKEGETYRFVLEWIYAPKGDVLSTSEFRYIDTGKDEGLENSNMPVVIEKGLDSLIQKLPFLGQVTGTDGDTITVSVGRNQNVKPNDVLTIYTLQSLKRHPILKTIEEWRWQPIGRAQVEQVEESLSFAKIIETEPGQKIIRFQKVREIIPYEEATKNDQLNNHLVNGRVKEGSPNSSRNQKDRPRLGWVAANVGIGNYSRDVGGLPANADGRAGGGLLFGFELDSQVWLNSRLIAQGSLMGTSFKYGPKSLTTGTSTGASYGGSGSQFRLAVGYSLFPMRTIHDSIAWVHLGYKSTHYSLPAQAADYTGVSDFGSLFIGVGGQVSLQERLGAELGIDLGVLKSASQVSPVFGDASGSNDLGLRIGGTYRLDEQFYARLLIKLSSQSMDFISGQSVSEKMFSIMPSIMYYF